MEGGTLPLNTGRCYMNCSAIRRRKIISAHIWKFCSACGVKICSVNLDRETTFLTLPRSASTNSQGSCEWFKQDCEVFWVKLEQILQLKVGCPNLGPVRDLAIYPTYGSDYRVQPNGVESTDLFNTYFSIQVTRWLSQFKCLFWRWVIPYKNLPIFWVSSSTVCLQNTMKLVWWMGEGHM